MKLSTSHSSLNVRGFENLTAALLMFLIPAMMLFSMIYSIHTPSQSIIVKTTDVSHSSVLTAKNSHNPIRPTSTLSQIKIAAR